MVWTHTDKKTRAEPNNETMFTTRYVCITLFTTPMPNYYYCYYYYTTTTLLLPDYEFEYYYRWVDG